MISAVGAEGSSKETNARVHRVQTQFYTLGWGRGPRGRSGMMAFPDDWLRESQGLIPLSIVSRPSDTGKMIGSRTHGGVDQTLGLIGSDDDVCSSGSYLLFTHSLYCFVVIRCRLSDHISSSALSLSLLWLLWGLPSTSR